MHLTGCFTEVPNLLKVFVKYVVSRVALDDSKIGYVPEELADSICLLQLGVAEALTTSAPLLPIEPGVKISSKSISR